MRSGKISASEDGAVHLDTTQIEPGEISPGQICRREICAMAFAIFRLEVEPVRSQYLLDLLDGENANRCPRREIGHSSEGRSRPIRIRHAAILLRIAACGRHHRTRPSPLRPGPAGHVQGGLVPSRGEMVYMWKWRFP